MYADSLSTAPKMDLQKAKSVVHQLWQPVRRTGAWLPDGRVLDEAVIFHGPAPIDRVEGKEPLIETVYRPLAAAFPTLRRNPYLFLAGIFEGNVWVATTGDLIGRQEGGWLGIPPGDGRRRLRFGEFYRIDASGKVVEIRCLFDILGLASQAGFDLLPPFQGEPGPPSGPVLENGLCHLPQDEQVSFDTLQLIEDMLGGCNRLDGSDLESMGMAAYWHEDMVWHGPWGVGSCRGFQDFQDHAQGPSVASFPDRRGGFHRARIAEGLTGAFTGWPSLRGTFSGTPFRGIAPTGGPVGQNIMDFYVRRGDRLHENWVLIDLIDFARQCGVDLLQPLKA